MRRQFEANIRKNSLFTKDNRLLLAVSGGMDSTALAHLLHAGGFNFSIAHCNFMLRGEESMGDEKFCHELSARLGVECFATKFDTEKAAERKKQSIQMAARDLRYTWLLDIIRKHRFDYLLTAHHGSDLAETMILNLLRGSGSKGLSGIPEKRGIIVRPLLPFFRSDIEAWLNENNIAFRLDNSNMDDKYARNYVRMHIIPQLKKLNPEFERMMQKSAFHLRQESGIVAEYLSKKKVALSDVTPGGIRINIARLSAEAFPETILHHLLGPFRFNQSSLQNLTDMIRNKSGPGKVLHSPTHRLTVDREEIVVVPGMESPFNVKISTLDELSSMPGFRLCEEQEFSQPEPGELLVDPNRLIFPMTLRSRQSGDKFRPFGMKGYKLLSDFLKEQKLNTFEKENCRVLVNGNGEIIWIAGLRSDDRYKVGNKDKCLVKLTLLEK